jgi:DtxR family Mn-dependent transcriptional regulator
MEKMSESEEMYLITVARFVEDGYAGPVPLSRLADRLSVAPVSVNQMIKKLEEAGLVDYVPYKGVLLTEIGRRTARRVLRLRRLWELFLVKHLSIPLEDADALACRMEHITSDEVADRLAAFLDNPTISVTGKPIPASDPGASLAPPLRLADLIPGELAEILYIDSAQGVEDFLSTEGLQTGIKLEVLAVGSNRAMLIDNGERQCTLAAPITEDILIRKIDEAPAERPALQEEASR